MRSVNGKPVMQAAEHSAAFHPTLDARTARLHLNLSLLATIVFLQMVTTAWCSSTRLATAGQACTQTSPS